MQRGGGQIPIGRGQKLPDRPQLPMIGNRGGQPQIPAVPPGPRISPANPNTQNNNNRGGQPWIPAIPRAPQVPLANSNTQNNNNINNKGGQLQNPAAVPHVPQVPQTNPNTQNNNNRGGQPRNPAVPERPPAYLDHASLAINPYPPHPTRTLPPNLVGVQGKQWCYVTCGKVTLNASEENFQRKKINPPGCFIGGFKVTRRNLKEIPSYLASHQSSMATATSVRLGYSGRPDPSGEAIFMFTFSKTIRSGNETRYDYAAPRYGVIVSDMDRNGGQRPFDRDSYPLYQFKPVPRENSFSEFMILDDTRRLDTNRGEPSLLTCSFQLDRGSDEKTPPDVQWHLWHLEKPGDTEPYGQQVTKEPALPELQGTKEVTDDEYNTSRNNNSNNAHNPNNNAHNPNNDNNNNQNTRNVPKNNGVINNNNAGNNDSEGFDILNQSGDVQ